MGVSLLNIFVGVEEASEVHIAGAFDVHDLDIGSIEDTDSYLEFFWWSITDVPLRMFV